MVGLSARISEFNPALALSNFQHMDDLVAERIRLINLYRRLLSGVSGISFQAFPPDRQSSGIHMVIRVAQTAFGLSRDELQQQLLSERIESISLRPFICRRCTPDTTPLPVSGSP